MNANLTELNRLRELEEEVAREMGVRADALRRMLSKVEEYSESHRAHGLPDDLLNILKGFSCRVTRSIGPSTATSPGTESNTASQANSLLTTSARWCLA